MEDSIVDTKKLQEALTKIASVCEEHVAKPREHQQINMALKLIADTLSKLINERAAAAKEDKVV